MANIGAIVSGAFRLVRERPGAVAVWGAAYLIGMIALLLLVGLLGSAVDTRSIGMDGLPHRGGGFYITMLFFYLGQFLLTAILMNAIFRSMLRTAPGEQRFFSLRVGMDEWRMFGLMLLVIVCSIVIGIVFWLLMLLLGLMVRLAAGDNELVAGIGGILLLLGWLCGWIWVGVRISLLYPLTFYRRAISLDEAWSLTRGRFWSLFAAYLVVFVLLLAVFCTLFWFSFGDVIRAMFEAGADPVARQMAGDMAFAQIVMATPLAVRVLVGLIWVVAMVIGSVLWFGITASATRELLHDEGEVLDEDIESTAAIFE